MAGSQWSLLLLPTHKGTAPFLHVGALAAITALSWIVAGQFARAERSCKYSWAGPDPPPPCPPSTKASFPALTWVMWGPHPQHGGFWLSGPQVPRRVAASVGLCFLLCVSLSVCLCMN